MSWYQQYCKNLSKQSLIVFAPAVFVLCITVIALQVWAIGEGAAGTGSSAPDGGQQASPGDVNLTADEVLFLKDFVKTEKDRYLKKRQRAEAYEQWVTETADNLRAFMANSGADKREVQYAIEETLKSLSEEETGELVADLATSAIDNGFDSWAVFYWRAMARLNSDRHWRHYTSIERDLMHSLHRIEDAPGDYAWLEPNVWDIHLGLAKLRYRKRDYAGMIREYVNYCNQTQRRFPQRNPLASDWDELTVSQQIRRVIEDLDLEHLVTSPPQPATSPLDTIFADLLTNQEGKE